MKPDLSSVQLAEALTNASLSLFTMREYDYFQTIRYGSNHGPADYNWLLRKYQEMNNNGTNKA